MRVSPTSSRLRNSINTSAFTPPVATALTIELAATDIVVALARLSDERAQAQAHRTGLIEAELARIMYLPCPSEADSGAKLGPGRNGPPQNVTSHAPAQSVPGRLDGHQN